MKTVSFANQPKPVKDNKRPQGLSSQFFTTLIKLESDFSNKHYTAETLDELTQYYAVKKPLFLNLFFLFIF